MADRRHVSSTSYGFPGLLAYIPSEDPQNVPGILETYRFTSEFPHFRILEPLKTLYAPSISSPPETSSRLWRERRTQERWLFKTHPDAFMGNSAFQDVLKEDMEKFRDSDEMINDRPLLAIGQLQDLGAKSADEVQQVMATPTGESRELLRIARMDDSQWQWGEAKDAFVNISTVDPTQKESEVVWGNDGLPIMQVKFESDRYPSDSHRWLLVQKQTSTTILRPEYRETITAASKPTNLSIDQRPSFIHPNPIMTIHHHQTGKRAHSDIILIPIINDQPLQLAIIDECGYWIIWDIMGTKQVHKNKILLDFHRCGHIDEGLLEELPLSTSYPGRKHGLIFIGRTEEIKIKDESPLPGQNLEAQMTITRHLVIWNEERIEVLDMQTNITMPKLTPFLTERGKPDLILDIQRSPVRQEHLFILTKHRILWVDVFGSNPVQKSPPKPSVLLSCPHLGTNRDASRMFVCRASEEDNNTSFAFIYYPQRKQLSIFWFRFSPKSSIPQWHRDTISLLGSDESHAQSSIQHISVDQAQLAISVKPDAESPGIDYHKQGTVFYQLAILWDDLSLQHCLCAISEDLAVEITVPDTRVAWSEAKKQQRWEKKRQLVVNLLSSTFILPDEMPTNDINILIPQRKDANEEPRKESPSQSITSVPEPVRLKFDRIFEALQETLDDTAMRGEIGLPTTLFDTLRKTLQEGYDYGRLPFLTWNEIMAELPPSDTYETIENGMEDAVEKLFEENDEHKVITQLRTYKPDETPFTFIGLPFLRNYFSQLWLDPVEDKLPKEVQQVQKIWISVLAKDAFLSNYGLMIQDVPLLGPQSAEAFEESQDVQPSSRPKSSQTSWGIMSSSPPRSSAPLPTEDGAIKRLQMLCSGLDAGTLDLSKQSKVISYWPTERGVDPADYISSVAKANEELFRGAKERLQKIEAKRKSRAEKYKRPAFMRQGLPDLDVNKATRDRSVVGRSPVRPPPVQAQSSQAVPDSSQTQSQDMFGASYTMSQPVSGAFGDRKKAKKGKRKSGFR